MRNALLILASAAILCACGTTHPIVEGPVYPAALPRSGTVDIQVIRQGTKIQLTNTTARRYGPSTLWLNQRYATTIDGLEVGEVLTLPLGDFLDEFSQKFRAGGFFATRDPDRLALAELDTGSEIVGLVVVNDPSAHE